MDSYLSTKFEMKTWIDLNGLYCKNTYNMRSNFLHHNLCGLKIEALYEKSNGIIPFALEWPCMVKVKVTQISRPY